MTVNIFEVLKNMNFRDIVFFIGERNHHPSGIPDESKKDESVQKELKTHHPSVRNSDVNPENVFQQMLNGATQSVDEINISLDELNINNKLSFESKAKVLSHVYFSK